MSSIVFEPFKIKNLELENRFVRSATWDGSADDSGAVTDTSVAIYDRLARGGVGLILTGYTYITPLGQAGPRQYGIHTDDMIPGMKRLVEAVHRGGARIALQMVHAGANSRYLTGKGEKVQVVSSLERINAPYHEMTDEEIEQMVSDYVAAVLRAREAGFDAVQFHGAHGYGMSQFLSPLFNVRTDRWGGSAENRRRLHLEVIRKARQVAGADFPLMIKFAVRDEEEGGLATDEGVETAKQMEKEGIDAIEASSGVGTTTRMMAEGGKEQAYLRDRAVAVKRAVSVPVIAVGGIRSLEMAEDIIKSGDADLVSMCRPFIREPEILLRWQRGETEPSTCISCSKCFAVMARGDALECGEDRRLRREAASKE
jgi:2,4-dienoyl-CoA reductase-like NADH-dependent reductase (Old Yellow Enzyme family)